MASITDLIMQQVQSVAGGTEIPSNIKNTVLNGLGQSVLGSLTQTASKAGGVEEIKNLVNGKTSAANSSVTALAGNLFNKNVLSGLNINSGMKTSLLALVPSVVGNLGNVIKDRDGDGDVDLNDIILSLKGGSAGTSSLLGAASSILGSFLKK